MASCGPKTLVFMLEVTVPLFSFQVCMRSPEPEGLTAIQLLRTRISDR
jgi:hypothetical protein